MRTWSRSSGPRALPGRPAYASRMRSRWGSSMGALPRSPPVSRRAQRQAARYVRYGGPRSASHEERARKDLGGDRHLVLTSAQKQLSSRGRNFRNRQGIASRQCRSKVIDRAISPRLPSVLFLLRVTVAKRRGPGPSFIVGSPPPRIPRQTGPRLPNMTFSSF